MQTLREILKEGRLPTKKLFQLATQIADGMAKAHAAGIVHRDLKPENLMVATDGFVKILDFGLAKLMPAPAEVGSEVETITKATQAGVIMGTIQYMSPEQAAGRHVDHRSDQFAFGSIVYEMVTRKPAFKKATTVQTLAAILEVDPEPLDTPHLDVSPGLRAILERCLAKDPQQRYDSTADLARELTLEREQSAFTVTRQAPVRAAATWGGRQVLLVAGGLLAAFVVTALALNPNDAIARHGLADYLLWTGDLDESVRQVELGRQADPLLPLTIGPVIAHLAFARRYDEAIAQAEEAIEFLPDLPTFHSFLAFALWQQGSYERALAEQRKAGPQLTRLAEAMEPAYRQGGLQAAMRAAADFLVAQSESGGEFAPLEVAEFYGAAGEKDLAFEWLQKALDARIPQLFHLKADPYFDSLRSDPRYQDLLQRIGSPR